MGLLDAFYSDDPRQQALLSMAFGLLGGNPKTRRNFGADLANAGEQSLNTYANAKQQQLLQENQERQNRSNDLQQLSGTYNLLKQQEFGRLAQGLPPNPLIGQIEGRMSDLLTRNNLSGRTPQNAQLPTTPPGNVTQAGYGALLGNSAPSAPGGNMGPLPQPPAGSPNAGNGSLGGPAFGVPMAAYLAADPTGKTYLEALQKQGTPISTRFGVYTMDPKNPSQVNLAGGMIPQNALPIQMGPQGASIQTLPGQTEAIKSIVNAQKAGEAPYDIKMVTNASGAQVPVSVAQIAEGRQPQASQASPQAPQQAPAQSQDPFTTVPKRYVPQGLGQTTFDKEMAGKQAEAASALAGKLGAQADSANQRIALNNQAMDLVDKSDTGPKAAQIGDVKNWLVSRFGIPEASFQNTPTATQALQKDLLNAATQKAKQQFGSRITQSEVMLMLSRGAPNIDMTKSAIKYLLQSDNAMLGYQVKQADDFGTYLQKGGDPMRFESWYAKTFPATHELSTVQPNTSPQQKPRTVRFQDLP